MTSFQNYPNLKKVGSIGNIFDSLGNLINLRKKKSIAFFVTFTVSLFESGVCLLFHKGRALNLKRNQTSNREKAKLS